MKGHKYFSKLCQVRNYENEFKKPDRFRKKNLLIYLIPKLDKAKSEVRK